MLSHILVQPDFVELQPRCYVDDPGLQSTCRTLLTLAKTGSKKRRQSGISILFLLRLRGLFLIVHVAKNSEFMKEVF